MTKRHSLAACAGPFPREHFDTLAGRVRSDELGWRIGPVGNLQGVQTFLRAPPTVPGPGPTR